MFAAAVDRLIEQESPPVVRITDDPLLDLS